MGNFKAPVWATFPTAFVGRTITVNTLKRETLLIYALRLFTHDEDGRPGFNRPFNDPLDFVMPWQCSTPA